MTKSYGETKKPIKQADIERAIRAFQAAGLEPCSLEMRPDGSVQISTSGMAKSDDQTLDSELDRWKRMNG